MSRRAAARLLQRLGSSTTQCYQARISSHVPRTFCSATEGPSTSGREELRSLQSWLPVHPSRSAAAARQASGAVSAWKSICPPQEPACAAAQALHTDAATDTDALELHELGEVTFSRPNSDVSENVQQQPDIPLDIRAYHLGGEIDFVKFCAENHIRDPLLQRDHAVIRLQGIASDSVLVGDSSQKLQEQSARTVVVYRFGTVVFFNMNKLDEQEWVGRIRQFTSEPLAEPLTDGSVVAVRHSLPDWFTLEPDKVVVQQLDVGNVRVISHIIGQSVALDHYNKKVDQAIEIFTPILGEIAHSGRSDTVKSTRLLQLIGQNSLLYTDVVTKLGLLDPSQIAWQSDRHYDVWRALRVDYEIDRRFEALKSKLGPMLENAKFILEVREDKKSERSELIIILLIFAEIVLHLAHHFLPQLAAVLEQL